jgi:hypothetical protein
MYFAVPVRALGKKSSYDATIETTTRKEIESVEELLTTKDIAVYEGVDWEKQIGQIEEQTVIWEACVWCSPTR